ncbi:hypothetical protein EZV76_17025, partial [Flagellimonas alvinocaridis]
MRLKLFQFSLKDKAKQWYNSILSHSISTWEEMSKLFLLKFFPAGHTMALQRQMQKFSVKPAETFYQAWERFKDLQIACPH